ncbi:MAG: hypothetical protein JNM80_11535 [Phycisphaerae bacterium]|nr:hypothetical protein [Phycisphaerae bacterium]
MRVWTLSDGAIHDAEAGEECARAVWTNPLAGGGWPIDAALRLAAFSGWHDPEPSDGESGHDDPTTRAMRASLRTWNAGGDEFRAMCEAAERAISPGGLIALRPRVGHALSDVPTCVRFLRERGGGPWRLLLDPVGMLSRGMLGDAEDHVRRIVDALGSHVGVWAMLLTNVEPGDEDPPRACVAHRGVIGVDVLREAASRSAAPLVLLEAEVGEQRRVLRV